MIDTILSQFYTADVVQKMGSYWYEICYSWSAFALIIIFAISAVVAFGVFLHIIMGWFR